jgi:hypothetical protein
MNPRKSVWTAILLVSPTIATAGAPWVSTPVTSAYPLQFRVSHPSTSVMVGTSDDLYSRIFGATRRSFDPRLCDTFNCFDQTADTKVLIRFPAEQQIWASATGHDRVAPCGTRSDLLSTFERYDGCDTFTPQVRRVSVELQPAKNEVSDDPGPKQVDRRPAAVVDVDRGSRGAVQHERAGRR